MTPRLAAILALLSLAACPAEDGPLDAALDAIGDVAPPDSAAERAVCAEDDDCEHVTAPRCDKETGACVACLAGDCAANERSKICDPSAGCVECLGDGDCAPDALGGRCWRGRCGCQGDDDCANSARGPTCHAIKSVCSCLAEKFCPGGQICGKDFWTKVCRPACAKDTDCPPEEPKCGSSGHCQECLIDGDCADNPAGVECRTRTDTSRFCGCSEDLHCSEKTWGNFCWGEKERCWCDYSASDKAHCAGNAHGPSCIAGYNWCGCKDDSECVDSDICAFLSLTAYARRCGSPCQSHADCAGKPGLAYCDPATGLCAACRTDADCPSSAQHCRPAGGWPARCVECTENAHCDVNPLRPHCKDDVGCVECLGSSNCTDNPLALGPTCESSLCVCVEEADCATHPTGTICDKVNRACRCFTDADCPPGRTCSGAFDSIQICQ